MKNPQKSPIGSDWAFYYTIKLWFKWRKQKRFV